MLTQTWLVRRPCFIAGSSISPIYVARPGFTFRVGQQTARLLLIRLSFSSWPLITSPALFAVQAGGGWRYCSALPLPVSRLPCQRNKAIRGRGETERCDEKQEHPPTPGPHLLSFFLTPGTDLSLNEGLTTETRVVEGVTGVPGNAHLPQRWLSPAATGDDSAPVQVFDPSD